MISKIFQSRKDILIFCFLFLIVLVSYYKLFSIFYQQDEWESFGRALLIRGPLDIFQGLNIIQIIFNKGRIIPFALGYLFFTKFPFSSFPFAIFSLIFHFVNTYLVYLLAHKFIKNKFFAVFAAVFFAVNSVDSSSVSWFGTSLGTIPSLTLTLLGILTFWEYLERQKKKWLFLTFAILYFSLFFKETGIYLFFLLPMTELLYRKQNWQKFFLTYWPFFLFAIIDSLFRIYDVGFLPQEQSNAFLGGSGAYYKETLLVRAIMYPLTSFSLVFVHPTPFLNLANFFARIYYPLISADQFPIILQTNVLDLLSILLTSLITIVIFIVFYKCNKNEKKSLVFWIVFTLTSFLPYIIITKNFTYLESRYYYFAAASMGIIFAFLIAKLIEFFRGWGLRILIILLAVIFLSWHFRLLQKDLQDQVQLSGERKSFLAQLTNFQTTLFSPKTIFYINSDTDYYMVGNRVPFQQGTGYTLMVWYFKSGKIPQSFYKEGFLYDLTSQGYKEINGYGFGYFSDLNKLKEAVKTNKLDKSSIYAFFYDSKKKLLFDTTKEVISKL